MSHRAAIVLAGANSRRLGGADKPSVTIGGLTLLERTCAAVRAVGVDRIVVVGPERTPEEGVVYTQESPPGSGPVAAVAAGLNSLDHVADIDLIVILACDMPGAASVLPGLLLSADRAVASGRDGAMARADGRDQFMMTVVSARALSQVLAALPLRDCAMSRIIEQLDLERFDIASPEALDVDTWQAIAQARHDIAKGADVASVDEWIGEANSLAQVDAPVDSDAILDLARDAAHGVARPAAPISTFILGYAAAARGLDAAAVAALASELGRAAAAHSEGGNA